MLDLADEDIEPVITKISINEYKTENIAAKTGSVR